jgi:hypothetical protein
MLRQLTAAERKQVVAALRRRESQRHIAAMLGLATTALRRMCRDAGIQWPTFRTPRFQRQKCPVCGYTAPAGRETCIVCDARRVLANGTKRNARLPDERTLNAIGPGVAIRTSDVILGFECEYVAAMTRRIREHGFFERGNGRFHPPWSAAEYLARSGRPRPGSYEIPCTAVVVDAHTTRQRKRSHDIPKTTAWPAGDAD